MKAITIDLENYNKVKREISFKDFTLLYIMYIGELDYMDIIFHNISEYHDSLHVLQKLNYIKIDDDCVEYRGSRANINHNCFELKNKTINLFNQLN